MAEILLAGADPDLTELLVFAFRQGALSVIVAGDPGKTVTLLQRDRPELILLDIDGQGSDGFDLLIRLRRLCKLPLIVLSHRADEDAKVRALELGADDYVTKPFNWRELLARVKAHLRRSEAQVEGSNRVPAEAVIELGPLRMDVAKHEVTRHGLPIHLTVTEFRLLECFMRRPHVVQSPDDLLSRVWGFHDEEAVPLLRTAMFRLRHKLEDDPHAPRLLHTIPGVGFLLGEHQWSPLASAS